KLDPVARHRLYSSEIDTVPVTQLVVLARLCAQYAPKVVRCGTFHHRRRCFLVESLNEKSPPHGRDFTGFRMSTQISAIFKRPVKEMARRHCATCRGRCEKYWARKPRRHAENYPKISFTLSKIDEFRSAGLLSTLSEEPSSSISFRCSRVNFVGV